MTRKRLLYTKKEQFQMMPIEKNGNEYKVWYLPCGLETYDYVFSIRGKYTYKELREMTYQQLKEDGRLAV